MQKRILSYSNEQVIASLIEEDDELRFTSLILQRREYYLRLPIDENRYGISQSGACNLVDDHIDYSDSVPVQQIFDAFLVQLYFFWP